MAVASHPVPVGNQAVSCVGSYCHIHDFSSAFFPILNCNASRCRSLLPVLLGSCSNSCRSASSVVGLEAKTLLQNSCNTCSAMVALTQTRTYDTMTLHIGGRLCRQVIFWEIVASWAHQDLPQQQRTRLCLAVR